MAWDLKGNTGTNPASDFRGTIDPQPVVVKTNNKEVVRIHADAPLGKVDVAAQEIMVTGFHPFITFRDTDNARSFVQGVNGDLFFSTESSIGGTTPMVLKNATGFVGIGTANPFSQLEIVGDGPFITLRDSARGNATCFIQDVGGDIILKPSSGDGQAVVLKTGSGNLGIGTGAPTEKLHVLGNARVVNDGGTGVALFVENTNNTTLLVENRTVFSAMVVNQSGTGNIMAGRNAS